MVYLVLILACLCGLMMLGVHKSSKIRTHADLAVADRTFSLWILIGNSTILGAATTLLWQEANFVKTLVPAGIYGKADTVLPAIAISVL